MNTNPYAPPKSQIEADTILKRSIWWKIYFYPITVLFLVGSIPILKEDSAGPVDYLMFGATLVATVGFFGFVYLKRFLFPKFWMVFFIVFLLYSVSYEFLTSIDLREGMSDKQYYISVLIGYIMSLPSYYALFSYGKTNNPIWDLDNIKRDSIPTKMLPIFWSSFFCGVAIYFFICLFIRYNSTDSGNELLSPENSVFLLAILSVIFALVSSYQYNKEIAHPLYHPIILFFKLLFSKFTLVPSIFFPLGVYSSHLLYSFIFQKDLWRSIFVFGTGMFSLLYAISLLGSFIGIFISNRKLSPNL